jgi:hypothetical protein
MNDEITSLHRSIRVGAIVRKKYFLATPNVGADEIACFPNSNNASDLDGADLAAFAASFNAVCLEPFAEVFGQLPQ